MVEVGQRKLESSFLDLNNMLTHPCFGYLLWGGGGAVGGWRPSLRFLCVHTSQWLESDRDVAYNGK